MHNSCTVLPVPIKGKRPKGLIAITFVHDACHAYTMTCLEIKTVVSEMAS